MWYLFFLDIQCKDVAQWVAVLCYFLFVDKEKTDSTASGYSRQYKTVRISVKEGALEKQQVSK